jgi:hypothetical protein
VAQAFDKGVRGGLAAPTQREVQNQLGVAFDGGIAATSKAMRSAKVLA